MRDTEADQADAHRHVFVEQLEGDLHEALSSAIGRRVSQQMRMRVATGAAGCTSLDLYAPDLIVRSRV